MNKNITFWSYRVEMAPRDHLNLCAAVTQERKFYNGVVSHLTGPMRTMANVFKTFTGATEEAFGLVAAKGRDVRSALGDRYGEIVTDAKTGIILEAGRAPGVIHPEMRRNIAVEILRTARDMTAAMHNTLSPLTADDYLYRHAVETLVEHDDKTKRHVQITKRLCRTEEHNEKTAIFTPYTVAPIVVPMPQMDWNIMVLREEETRQDDGKTWWNIEFHDTKAHYLVRKTDPIIRTKRAKTRNARQSRSHRFVDQCGGPHR